MRKGSKRQKRLDGRREDYTKMISSARNIGNGSRDVSGYHRPGSNKK